MGFAPTIHRPTLKWWLVLLVWAVPGVLSMLWQGAAFAMLGGGALQREWIPAVMQLPRWLLWAPFTPLIFAAVRRYPLAPPRVARSVLVHLGVAALAITVTEGAYAQLNLLAESLTAAGIPADRPPAIVLTLLTIIARGLSGLITYAAAVGVAMAMQYQHQLREREVRAAQLETDLARAQVQAIKLQVQPHFLFNTLHAINVLILEKPKQATRMVAQLGDLLRHTLNRAALTEVPLRNELEVLSLYLDIERVRFRDRLRVELDAAPDTLDAMVPDLLLQPLAENAIKHGIGQSSEPGTVRVHARQVGEELEIGITDSGPGPASDAPQDGVGLRTVRSRLERLYGAAQSLRVERGSAGGCVVTLRLPFRTAGND